MDRHWGFRWTGVLGPGRRSWVVLLVALLVHGCGGRGNQETQPTNPASSSAPTPSGASPSGPTQAAAAVAPPLPPASHDDYFDAEGVRGGTPAEVVDLKKLSPSELQYGQAPQRSSQVTYQPDVVVLEHGDRAIRSAGRDGMSWTFDAKAPGVNELSEGKIVFATSRAVGRIARLTRQGDQVTVVIGPVQITDVIRDGHFSLNQTLDLDSVVSYSAPDFPSMTPDPATPKQGFWSSEPMGGVAFAQRAPDARTVTVPAIDRVAGRGASGRFASPVAFAEAPSVNSGASAIAGGAAAAGAIGSAVQGAPAAASGPPPTIDLQDFKVTPIAGRGGVGMQWVRSGGGLTVKASGVLGLRSAGLRFVLDIRGGSIRAAGIRLDGSVGLTLSFLALSDQEFHANISRTANIPIDIAIPLAAGGVPFNITFHTAFTVRSGFSAKNSILRASGDYTFGGGLFAGYRDGAWHVDGPGAPQVKTDLAESGTGLSVGINSLVLGFSVRAMVGIGAFGFNTGIYVGLNFGGTMLLQSSVAMAPCRQGTLNAVIDSGVGYSIPRPIVDVVNVFLRVFKLPPINASGTLLRGPQQQLFDLLTDIPTGCAGAKGGAT